MFLWIAILGYSLNLATLRLFEQANNDISYYGQYCAYYKARYQREEELKIPFANEYIPRELP